MGNPVAVFGKDPQDMPGQGLARADNFKYPYVDQEYSGMINSLVQAQPQMYQVEADYAPKYNLLARQRLQDTINGTNGVDGIGTMWQKTLRAADPNAAQLSDNLTATANSELAKGAAVDPQLLRLAQQSVRSRTMGTLGSTGGAGKLNEALGVSSFANDLRNQRRSFAAGVNAMNDARNAGVTNWASGISGVSTGNLINPATSATLLNSAYTQNQQNNRTTAELETKVGMHQAETWNNWFKAFAGA